MFSVIRFTMLIAYWFVSFLVSYFKYLKYEFSARDLAGFDDNASADFVLFGLRVNCLGLVKSSDTPVPFPAYFGTDSLIFYSMFSKFLFMFHC